MKDYYQEGYEKGFAEGLAGRPSSHPGHLLDFLNIQDQQDYENGLEEGYQAGLEKREELENEEKGILD